MEDPVETLERWLDSGAHWRTLSLSDEWAVVELLTCNGEPVDRVEGGDPGLIRLLRTRPEA